MKTRWRLATVRPWLLPEERDDTGARERSQGERLDDDLARARLCENALEEDLALRDEGQLGYGARRRGERVATLHRGRLTGERVGLHPGELAGRGEGDNCGEAHVAVERSDGRGPGAGKCAGQSRETTAAATATTATPAAAATPTAAGSLG